MQFLNPYKRHTFPPPLRSCLYESRCRPSSHLNPVTDQNTSACGVCVTTNDVAGSFCEPQAAKLRNYCPYSEMISGCRSLHTFVSDHLPISLHLYMLLYKYLHQRFASITITLPPATQKHFLSFVLFREITQRLVVIPFRSLRQGQIVYCDTSVRNYNYTLCNFPEEHRSHLHGGGSLKSQKRCVYAQYTPRRHLATLFTNIVLSHQIWLVWFLLLLGIFLSRLARNLAGLKFL